VTSADPGRRGLNFVPLSDYPEATWSPPQDLFWIEDVGCIPIADTEMLGLAHFCPITIEMDESTPRVVAVVKSSYVAHSLLTDSGRWKAPYSPLALRAMPFRNATNPADGIEICPEMAGASRDPERRMAMVGQKGGVTNAFAQVQTMLKRLRLGGTRLSNAAKTLIGLDVLTPLAPLTGQHSRPHYTLRIGDLLALPASRILSLTTDACCPLDLACAMTFSSRALTPLALTRNLVPVQAAYAGVREKLYGHALIEPLDDEFQLDHSELFSLEGDSAHSKGME